MTLQTVFETGSEMDFDPTVLVPFAFLAIGIWMFVMVYKRRDKWYGYIFPAFWTLVASIAIVPLTYSYIDSRKHIYDPYRAGAYQVVEGKIEQFHPMPQGRHDTEHFILNGTYFAYPDPYGWGYSTVRYEGGLIKGNGQYVQIGYIDYRGDNVIVKLSV